MVLFLQSHPCRTRALTELERDLVGRLPELQHVKDASRPSEKTRELDDAWEEATKAVTERYERVPHLPQRTVFALTFSLKHTLGRVQAGAVPCPGGAAEEVPARARRAERDAAEGGERRRRSSVLRGERQSAQAARKGLSAELKIATWIRLTC